MNFVKPIHDRKQIAQIKNLRYGEGQYRDLLLFVVGIHTALQISDLLKLQVKHFSDDHQPNIAVANLASLAENCNSGY